MNGQWSRPRLAADMLSEGRLGAAVSPDRRLSGAPSLESLPLVVWNHGLEVKELRRQGYVQQYCVLDEGGSQS